MKAFPVNDKGILWAYRILLGRDPENELIFKNKRQLANVACLVDMICSSPEFLVSELARDISNNFASRNTQKTFLAHLIGHSFIRKGKKAEMQTLPVDDETIRWAYRILLGRDPENEQAFKSNRGLTNLAQLVEVIIGSPEFLASKLAGNITNKVKNVVSQDTPQSVLTRLNSHSEITNNKISDKDFKRIDMEIETAENRASNDDDLRSRLARISGELTEKFSYLSSFGDPFSGAYIREVEKIHQKIIGKPYSVTSEGLPDLNTDWEKHWAFPYGTKSASTVGGFLIAYGYIIKIMELPADSRILEVGCGLGSFTFLLAKMGYKVDALDVSESQCAIVQKIVEQLPTQPNVICSSLDKFLILNNEKYDAIIFFESFHHFLNHHSLLEVITAKHLTSSGKIVLAGEPIFHGYDDCLPYPWGVRLDGESLRAMRKWGWLELGFTEMYIKEMFKRVGLSFVRHKAELSPWADVIVGVP